MSDKKDKKKSFMDTVREVNERERVAELEAEAEKAEKLAEYERAKRDEYSQKLKQDRIELLKLKNGMLSEEDIPKVTVPVREYSAKEKIGNFFYHNKGYLIVGAFILTLVVFFIYDMARQVKPDVSVMVIATDENFNFYTDKMAEVFEQYCPDYNGDRKVSVRVAYLPAIPDTSNTAAMYLSQSDQTKLIAEFQSVDSIIVIADNETITEVGVDGVFMDLRFVYKDDENANMYGYMLNGTNFANDIGYEDMAEDLFIAFREPHGGIGINEEKFQKNYDDAIELWTNYLNGNVINPIETEEQT